MIDFILRPIRRNYGKDKMFYRAIDDMFGFIPHNIELYKLALIHKSASIVLEDGQHINNERLEFLGDAVIESVSSDYLFIEFPDKNEGFLTQLRSKMVSRQSLNSVAKRIGLDDHVITNASSSTSQKHIYGDAFEAMMGAIYLDQGYDFVNRLLINKIFTQYLKMETLAESETDFKSRLIEWCQKNHHTIHFATSHDKTYSTSHPFFYSKVLIDDIEVGHGAGESKKEAEQRAAFSVSQGFNDADCTKLLDRLDNFDTHISKAESKPIEKSPAKQEKQEKQKPRTEQPKEETKVKTEVVAEKKEQPAEPKAVKTENTIEEAKPKASRPRRVTKPKAAVTTEEQPQKEESAKNNAQPKSDEQPKNESTPKRTRKATPKSKNVAEVNEKPAEEAQPEANNQTENKPKPRRRRPVKEKATNAVTTTETAAPATKE